ncbi:universal stress protein [Hymenobacter swuensis]|uniref:UspA domain-containing protein n=1 Tax=Hymenobacter swuensis DY53 TaxID=1227739 RepID=W8F0J7_9BACT|nr:universal stress protein [Hymenobacter swuensis]AHJ97527.1 hypothetical protein Hsw_1932 [Hymenobacter swuensis DY53]
MLPSIVVLTNLTPAAEQAARYAAVLGQPVHAQLRLLHLYHDPILDPELATITTAQAVRSQAETLSRLEAMGRRLPAPSEALLSVQGAFEAVEDVARRYQPLLLAMGLSSEHDLFDNLLRNQALPVLRATHRPLLLVPEGAALLAAPPRRVAVAVDAEPFVPNPAARAVAPLLAAWPATYTVVHVATEHEQEAFPGQHALGNVHQSGLLPPATRPELCESRHLAPADGILQAVNDVQADLLVLITRPRSFLGRLFHHSVTAQVLRRSRVPVLLLPAEAPELPGWMPHLS